MVIPCLCSFTVPSSPFAEPPVNKKRTRTLFRKESGSSTNCMVGRVLHIRPGGALRGTRLSAPDLRGGAALVLAALAAQGRSQIGGVAYLDRGYADFTEILASLGARIYRETKPA